MKIQRSRETGSTLLAVLLLTGIIPAVIIAVMLPFVPESKIWQERKKAGTLKRPSFGALFSPEFRRVTVITAGLSACAYGIAKTERQSLGA